MATEESIAKLALSHLASQQNITDLENDQTPEAQAFRIHYPAGKLNALTELDFQFIEREVTLTERTDLRSSDTASYYYERPANVVKIIRASSAYGDDVFFREINHETAGIVLLSHFPLEKALVTLDLPESEMDAIMENFVALSTAKQMLTNVALSVEPAIREDVTDKWEQQRNILMRNNLGPKTRTQGTYEGSRLSEVSQ